MCRHGGESENYRSGRSRVPESNEPRRTKLVSNRYVQQLLITYEEGTWTCVSLTGCGLVSYQDKPRTTRGRGRVMGVCWQGSTLLQTEAAQLNGHRHTTNGTGTARNGTASPKIVAPFLWKWSAHRTSTFKKLKHTLTSLIQCFLSSATLPLPPPSLVKYGAHFMRSL